MVRKCPEPVAAYGVKLLARTMLVPRTASMCESVAAKADSQDGYNITFAALDELHAHKS